MGLIDNTLNAGIEAARVFLKGYNRNKKSQLGPDVAAAARSVSSSPDDDDNSNIFKDEYTFSQREQMYLQQIADLEKEKESWKKRAEKECAVMDTLHNMLLEGNDGNMHFITVVSREEYWRRGSIAWKTKMVLDWQGNPIRESVLTLDDEIDANEDNEDENQFQENIA
jgi:hypothetical protein